MGDWDVVFTVYVMRRTQRTVLCYFLVDCRYLFVSGSIIWYLPRCRMKKKTDSGVWAISHSTIIFRMLWLVRRSASTSPQPHKPYTVMNSVSGLLLSNCWQTKCRDVSITARNSTQQHSLIDSSYSVPFVGMRTAGELYSAGEHSSDLSSQCSRFKVSHNEALHLFDQHFRFISKLPWDPICLLHFYTGRLRSLIKIYDGNVTVIILNFCSAKMDWEKESNRSARLLLKSGFRGSWASIVWNANSKVFGFIEA